MKQVDKLPQWREADLHVPVCRELLVSGSDWKEYRSEDVLCLDEYGDYHIAYVHEVRYDDGESFYEWLGHEGGDIVCWQYLPAKPDAGRR